MKIKFLLLTILTAAFTLLLNARDDISENLHSFKIAEDSVFLQSNNNEEIVVVRRDSEQLNVSRSNMSKHRKQFDCPDIFAPEPRPKTPSITQAPPILEPKVEIKEPVRGKPFFLPDPIFFRINNSDIDDTEWDKIELAVSYLIENPGSTVIVTGYADKNTGNTKINLHLSQLRSNAVADALETKYGINKNRISVNWKGDGLQPFELDNDKNRAVLFLINP